jgi:hypothetical protein
LEPPGANEQILQHQTSDFTPELWQSIQGYKQTASDNRLGLPRTMNSSLKKTPAGLAKLQEAAPGVSKGQTLAKTTTGASIVQEMKDKRDQGKRVKFLITFAKSVRGDKKGAADKMQVVCYSLPLPFICSHR